IFCYKFVHCPFDCFFLHYKIHGACGRTPQAKLLLSKENKNITACLTFAKDMQQDSCWTVAMGVQLAGPSSGHRVGHCDRPF
uniref:Uncharacterized protein n=1 Tax=Monopterus albus TaxID=43700 RepID=A0A3Q3JIX1_MONAL